jgi:hypothetical protein
MDFFSGTTDHIPPLPLWIRQIKEYVILIIQGLTFLGGDAIILSSAHTSSTGSPINTFIHDFTGRLFTSSVTFKSNVTFTSNDMMILNFVRSFIPPFLINHGFILACPHPDPIVYPCLPHALKR